MAIIQKNDVFEHSQRKFRILVVGVNSIVWFELGQNRAWPVVFEKKALVDLLTTGEACRVDDPFIAPIYLSPSLEHTCRRDKAFETIRQIVEHSQFYDTHVRIELTKLSKLLNKTTDKVINNRLKKYWTYGQSKNALYPRYGNCGAPGLARTFTNKRSGRPRINGTGNSAISTEDVRRLYRRAIEDFYFIRKRSFSAAFRQFKLLYLTLYRDAVENEIPTEPQMRHFYNSQYRAIDKATNRMSGIAYRKDVRTLVSTATSQALGPGSRYEIDATILDIYCVSDYDLNRVLGRPVLYILIDVFTRMVAGFYIGFKSPSYNTVISALINSALSKEESLKEIGETDPSLWPVSGLPEILLADKGGEFFGKQSNNLLDIFAVHTENAPAYRADARGIGERYFDIIQSGFKNIADGVVTPSKLKKGGERDYRADANVPYSVFRQFMIRGIVTHNHKKISRSYDRAKDIPDDLPMTPISLWNWGIANRSGSLKSVNKQQLIAGLLPKATATTSDLGLCFRGVYYNVAELIDDGAFLRKGFGDRSSEYQIAYDSDCLNIIYVFINSRNDYVVATLHPRSAQYTDMSLNEIEIRNKTQKEVGTAVKQASDTSIARIEAHSMEVFDEIKKRAKHLPAITAAAKTSGIPANKKQAQREERLQKSKQLFLEEDTKSTIEDDEFESFTNPALKSLIKQQRKDAK